MDAIRTVSRIQDLPMALRRFRGAQMGHTVGTLRTLAATDFDDESRIAMPRRLDETFPAAVIMIIRGFRTEPGEPEAASSHRGRLTIACPALSCLRARGVAALRISSTRRVWATSY